MKLNEAKELLDKNGYKVISESASDYDYVASILGKRITFVATYLSEDYGEPDEEEFIATSWSGALKSALKFADENAMFLVKLDFKEEVIDEVLAAYSEDAE